jgi:hypothetical protein
MNEGLIGQRRFTDGVTRPVYEDERGQYIVEDGLRIDGYGCPLKEEADVPEVREANP